MKTADNALQIGAILDNRYKVEGILGIGGFGITYKAHDDTLDCTVVIKEYLPEECGARDSDTTSVIPRTNREDDYQFGLEKYLEEARTLAKFKHPNIVKVTNFIKANGTAYIIMDFEEGQDLDEWLKSQPGALSEETILNIITPILKGLSEVHKTDFLHRDIKPGNIFLRNEGGPMLIDFGAARMAMGEHSKSISAIISMGYAPPEQYTTRGKQGPYTDLYAVGAVLYKLIIGSTPIESPDRSHDIHEGEPDPLTPATEAGKGKVSDWLLHITDQLLNISPKQRPQNAEAVLTAIQNKTSVSISEAPEQEQDSNKTRVVKSSERFEKEKPSKPGNKKPQNKQSGSAFKWIAIVVAVAVFGAVGYFFTQQPEEIAEKKTLQKGQAVLFLNSKPQGADVYLDGFAMGKTPFNASDLPAGEHEFKLSHADYQDIIEKIILSNNVIIKKTLKLKLATGNLSVFSTPEGASIYIDGKDTQQSTPATVLNIKSGARSLTLKKDRYYPLNNEVQIIKGKTIRADLSLKGGDLVKYNGNWIEVAERDRLKAQAKAQRLAEAKAKREKQAAEYRQQAKSKASDGQFEAVQDLIGKAQKLVGSKPEDNNTLALARKAQQQQRVGKMITVPGGSFQMGSNRGSAEKPVHWVNLKAFKLGKYEVTQKQWRAVMGNNPSNFKGCDNCPVERVTWNGVQGFLKKLNQQTRQRFRLPSEAEWEYACRSGGRDEKYCGGSGVGSVAWKRSNSVKKTHPVGQKQVNGLGLYDMSGNVWEWAQDCWNNSYNGAPANGKAWSDGDCGKRVLRGGSWSGYADGVRSAFRVGRTVTKRDSNYGFRLAQDL